MSMNSLRVGLSCDGGGIRGFIGSGLMEEIETATGKPIRELVKFFIGSSTGAILALALAAGIPAKVISKLYRTKGPGIFHRPWWARLTNPGSLRAPKYQPDALRAALTEVFGDLRMGDPSLPPVVVTAADLTQWKPWFIKSHDEEDADILLVDAAMASAAAPTYFPPHTLPARPGSLVTADGGLFRNNPSASGLAEMKKLWDGGVPTIVSVGTGGERERGHHFDNASGWGVLRWVPILIQIFMDFPSAATHHELWIGLPEEQYIRLDPPSPGVAMDETSDEAFSRMAQSRDQTLQTVEWERFLSLMMESAQ